MTQFIHLIENDFYFNRILIVLLNKVFNFEML